MGLAVAVPLVARGIRVDLPFGDGRKRHAISSAAGALVMKANIPAGSLANATAAVGRAIRAIRPAVVGAELAGMMEGSGHMVSLLNVREIPERT